MSEYSEKLYVFCQHLISSGKKLSAQTLQHKFKKELDLLLKETDFLNLKSLSLSQRIWHVVNDSKSKPLCKECNTKFVKWGRNRYRTFCGTKCSSLNNDVRNKSKKTCLDRYGVEAFLQSDEAKNKSKKTCLGRYGVDRYTKTDEYKAKIEKTNLEKYGVSHYSKTKEFKQKLITTQEKKCGRPYHKQKHISDESFQKLNDKEWLYEQHYVKNRFLVEIALELGVSDCTVGNYIRKHGLETQQQSFSLQERDLGLFIKSYFPNTKFNYKILGRKEVDIFVPEKNVAIEYNGLYHHSSFKKPKLYHREKFLSCKELNIRLINIYEDEWKHRENIVKNKLLHILGVSCKEKVYARKCEIKGVSYDEKFQFLESFHIQGCGKGSVTFGLTMDNELCAVMTFIKRNSGIFELNRYATKNPVVGGFSKLLNHFKKNFIWKEIITFADLRWHTGDLYLNSGFTFDKELEPDYEYIVNKKRVHKFNFRRAKIKSKFPLEYDESLSEKELMEKIGIPRIYDCGKLRFVLENKEA